MSERRKRLLAYLFIVAVCVSYFGCGYYFGVTRPAGPPAPERRSWMSPPRT